MRKEIKRKVNANFVDFTCVDMKQYTYFEAF